MTQNTDPQGDDAARGGMDDAWFSAAVNNAGWEVPQKVDDPWFIDIRWQRQGFGEQGDKPGANARQTLRGCKQGCQSFWAHSLAYASVPTWYSGFMVLTGMPSLYPWSDPGAKFVTKSSRQMDWLPRAFGSRYITQMS
jgi:hypothetical protein